MRMKVRYLTHLEQVDGIGEVLDRQELRAKQEVEKTFPFRSNSYYLSRIDWSDPEDPLRRIVVPDPRELEGSGALDPSSEKSYTRVPGLQHKYPQTALLLVSDVCGGICRFCFRKRLFLTEEREVAEDIPACMEYIREHREITNVLLSGGDPLMLPTRGLEAVVRELREIPHVQIIRIGTKMPAYNPHRILDDPELLEMIRRYSTDERRIYVMAHFNHPKELSGDAMRALAALQSAGAVVVNQTPLIAGINSSPAVLSDLLHHLSFIGVSPYYIFQCRPVTGNRIFTLPVEKSYQIIQAAFARCSGLAKRARFIMSHASGKIEVVGRTAQQVFMKYHQAADAKNQDRFMVFHANPHATWFDDYQRHLTEFLPRMHWLF